MFYGGTGKNGGCLPIPTSLRLLNELDKQQFGDECIGINTVAEVYRRP